MKQYQYANDNTATAVKSTVQSTPVEDVTARTVLDQLQRTVDYQSRKIARLEAQLEQLAAVIQRQR